MEIRNVLNALDTSCGPSYESEVENFLREELETAWLRGYRAHKNGAETARADGDSPELEAADYAERVVGGSTTPERPEAS